MADKSITDQIKHYQRDIDRCPKNSDRMIRCIQRLCIIPVTVQHLQDTGIGRSVNSLRKYGGEAADAAKALVAKWKAMVAAEESSDVEGGQDEPSPEKTKDTMSSPDLNQRSMIDNENKVIPSYQSDSDHRSLIENISSTSQKSNSIHKSNSDTRKSSHQSSSEYQTNSRHGSNSGYKSSSDEKCNLENRENHSDKQSSSKHRESNVHRSSSDSKSNSGTLEHRNSSGHKSKPEGNSSSSHRTSSSNHKSKSDSKSLNRDNEKKSDVIKNKEREHKTKKSYDSNSKERDYRHSKDKSKSTNSSSRDRKRPIQDMSEDESSSSARRKRKKSTDDELVHRRSNSKKKVEIKEESCDDNSDESDSDVNDNETNQSSGSEEDGSRHSSENSASNDESNDNSDQSSEHSNDESNSSIGNKHINGHSSQTSDSERDTESSSSNISDQRYKHKKSSRHHHEKSRSHDNRKSHSNHKSSHRDKYKNDKRKTEDNNKSSHCKEFPVKIKQEKMDEPVIKKEKDNKIENKNNRKSKEVKSSSHKSSKSSSSESKNTIKESTVKTIKIEKAPDGSIDCGSGASFADALLGMSGGVKKLPKKKVTSTSSSTKSSSSNITHDILSKSKLLSSNTSNEPLLLKKNIKLEPLEVDLAATLPEITPNYRPLPHYSPPSSPVLKRSKLMSQEEALSSIMSTKNQRTKVFSGNKCSGMSTVPSLFDFCIQVLRENIDALEYTGGVPFDVLKPVLDRATADQLYQLEHYNPYLVEDTDTLWAFHCNKDFRGKKREDLESWRDLYLRCLDERERKLKALTANISQSMAKSTPVRQTKLAYVDSIVKPPRNVARKQAKFGTANSTKHEIVSKAVIGAHSSSSGQALATDVVPAPPRSSASTSAATFSQNSMLKKKKAPLMAKALQLIKGNRFKR